MMTLLSSSWPAILGVLAGLAGVVFGLFKHQTAQVASAQAATADAKAQAANEKLQAVAADQKAEQAAQSKVNAAAAGRASIDAKVSAAPTDTASQELQNEFGR